jgi:hypothetical protein
MHVNPFSFQGAIAVDINELLGLEGEALTEALAGLNGDQLAELEPLLVEQANAIEDNTPESVATLTRLADAIDATRQAISTFEAAQAQAEQDAAAARARITGEPKNEDPDAPDPDEDPEGDPDPEAAAPEAGAPAAEPALVAGGRVRRMARQTGKAKPSPEVPDQRPQAVLTASAALMQTGMIKDGGRVQSSDELAEGMAEILNGMSKSDAPRGKVLLASARWKLPEDRQLKNNDQAHNDRVFAEALGKRPFLSLPEQALVASGGICAPVNVDYTVPGWATADRPLRDALPSFQADRGGITFVPPADIGTYAGATAVWTEATDANPAGATKPVVQVVCGSPTTVYVNAIPTRLGFGNMTGRFAPEQTAAAIDLAMAEAARIAEIELLQLIAAACVADVQAGQVLGATRDFLTTIYQLVAGYRSYHRIPESVKFTAIFPAWVRDMMKVDLVREIGHSQNDYFDALKIDDEYIDSLLLNAGVNPVWHLDGQSASQLSGAGGVAQIFAAQSASGAINPFPTKIVWYFFPEGVFQFLDGGRLDLGVVRDSTLDATNDFETFVEPFEGLAFRGFATGALQLVSTTGANGATGGTVTVGSNA